MHDLSGIRTSDPSIQAPVDLWLRPDGYGDRQAYALCEGTRIARMAHNFITNENTHYDYITLIRRRAIFNCLQLCCGILVVENIKTMAIWHGL